MTRLVFMVFSYDTVCFPSSAPYRVMTAGGTCTLTTHGAHRASLVASLTGFLAEHGIAVEDVEEAEGDNCFAMIMLGRVASSDVRIGTLRELVQQYGKTLGVSVRVQREDLYLAMHRI